MELILDWKSLGSLLATFVFIRTAIRDFLPPEVYQALKRLFSKVFSSLQPKCSIIIEEYDNSYTNELYDSVQLYLSSNCFSAAQVLKLSKLKNSKNLTFTMDANQKLEEIFEGFKVKWSFHSVEKKSNSLGYSRPQENRYFELSFHRRDKNKVQSSYIPHVMEVAEHIRFKNRERKLYTNRSADEDGRLWSSVPFAHPSTFDTVAIDPVLKQEIKDDLIKFVNRRDYYSRVGRAWKRGYLLYGPPGTGKTSLIAAIANFLEFDIYDLELTAVTSNSQLRKLLISTSSKSVIVVEDVDCSLDLSDRKKNEINGEEKNEKRPYRGHSRGNNSFGSTVSLSGVLNFVDGLWSSCGSERLMIFTTNHKHKLDPALLRPGRMDKHINLSYCEITAFKTLAWNYLEITKHELMEKVEEILPLVQMTPADIAEIFMSCEDDAEMGMSNVIEEMKRRLQSSMAKEDSSVAAQGKEEEIQREEEHPVPETHEDSVDSANSASTDA
ncbi:AAA-ATPase At3g50940-like [Telopea speciosissima]|uniref:AAA-ATPase At3g50940-like n=1 Tax=Telopea speciosissima TaxID=54955 RepID=UPI001CC7CD76|nr:AAA-ATPase At3g50940-like [Telopea speciosissima]